MFNRATVPVLEWAYYLLNQDFTSSCVQVRDIPPMVDMYCISGVTARSEKWPEGEVEVLGIMVA